MQQQNTILPQRHPNPTHPSCSLQGVGDLLHLGLVMVARKPA
jgi:hypothetical protein